MDRHVRIFLLAIGITLTLVACNSGFTSPYKVRGLRVDKPIFEVKGMRMADSSIRLFFTTNPRLRTKDPSIRTVMVAIGPSEDHMPDTTDFQMLPMGTPSEDDVVLVSGEAYMDSPTIRSATDIWIDVSVINSTDQLVFRQKVEFVPATPLELTPFATPAGAASIELGATVKRIYLPTNEYLPSAERFRIIVSDSSGAVVWRSDAGLSYSTIVLNVEPRHSGETDRQAITWNGKSLSGTIIPPGRYRADMSIPARPTPYTTSIEFSWPPAK